MNFSFKRKHIHYLVVLIEFIVSRGKNKNQCFCIMMFIMMINYY